jgi:subtilisin family serine protease
VFLGIDVMNFSGTIDTSTNCTPGKDGGNVNLYLRTAYNAGVLFFHSAGNDSHTGTCNLGWPGYRTDAVSVGGMQTNDASVSYGNVGIYTLSSQGGLPITLWDMSSTQTHTAISFVAPAFLTGLFRQYSSLYDTAGRHGTSYAAPLAAGAAGLLRQAFNFEGAEGNNAGVLKVNMLLLTDSYNFEQDAKTTAGTSPVSGAGRLRMHTPSDDSLVSPWTWGYDYFTVYPGPPIVRPVHDGGPIPSGVTQWKWAVFWEESNLNSVADITIEVFDDCHPTKQVIPGGSDWSYNLVKKISLRNSEVPIVGKCLMMRIIPVNVPSSGRVLYTADYYHAGSTTYH